jgi:hypothetical protein
MKSDFIPKSQSDLDTWQVNFKEKVTAIAHGLKIDDGETTEVILLLDAHRSAYAALVSLKADAKAATSFNNKAENRFLKSMRELANRIKSAKGYTEEMGNQLKIIGSEVGFDKFTAKPTMVVSKDASGVQIKFIKDKADGVYIYSKRGSETGFSFLAVDTASPYHDNRPNLVEGQGEKREYKACYFMDDAIVGQESDIAVITV